MKMTGSGGDCVRQMRQILEGQMTTKLKVCQALESQCKSWLGARMRFKDVTDAELEAQFQKNFTKAVSFAEKYWKDREAKLLRNFENEILKSFVFKFSAQSSSALEQDWADQCISRQEKAEQYQLIQAAIEMLTELSEEMPKKFTKIIDLREVD
jgi:hypothetical protein